jgi:hypothetical protein
MSEFQTGNVAADKFLNLLGENFFVMPFFNDDGTAEFITLADIKSQHAITIKFVDAGEPEFVFTEEVIPQGEGDDT